MRAEYDRTNNRVVTIETDDGRRVPTHNPRMLGAETEWVPAEVHYPEGYDTRYVRLLRADTVRYEYRGDEGKVVVTYPDADFSPEAVRAEVRGAIKKSAREMLSGTDWAVVRYVETGKAIPTGVSRERAAIREKADRLEAELDEMPDDEVASFSFSFTTDVAGRVEAEPVEEVKGGDGREWITDARSPGEEGIPIRPAAEEETQSGPIVPRTPTGLPWVDGDER